MNFLSAIRSWMGRGSGLDGRIAWRCGLCVVVCFAALVDLLPAASPQGMAFDKSPRFHDPSTPIRQGDTWYVFATGNGIVSRTSKDLKVWSEGKMVFDTFPEWHQQLIPGHRGYLWAPDIIHRGGRYLLYYSVSAWGKNTSAIGLVTNKSLNPSDPDYAWNDEGMIVRSAERDPFNAIDPQVFADSDGRLWLVFGSFWHGIQLTELDPKTGHRHPVRQTIKSLAWHETIEAPVLLKHEGYYYLFVNWGLCCRGLSSTYEIRMGRSRKVSGPYLDATGDDLATGGGSVFLNSAGDRIGPGHASFVENDGRAHMFFHFYDRKRGGFATIGDLPIRWTSSGWPEILEAK